MNDKVFIPRPKKAKPGLSVGVLLGKHTVKGEVGLEIEVEGESIPYSDVPPPWQYKEDHSLRGKENGEYVLKNPVMFSEIPDALSKLWGQFDKYKTKFDDSNRTSVHVHLNCQEWFLNRLAAFLGLYFTLEIPLTQWCGENRVGNLFCLRAVDAPAIITHLKKFIQTDGQYSINETMHYSGMNANALKKFGSLEIRTLRGTSDSGVIQDWLSILERLYTLSAEFADPRDVCTMLSGGGGPLAFFESVLGNKSDVVRQGSGMSYDQISDAVYNGIRLAQDLCYCRDWSLFKPMALKPDPFDRSLKKVANKIASSDPFIIEAIYGIQDGYNPAGQFGQFQVNVVPNVTGGLEIPASEPDYDEDEPEYDEDYEDDYNDDQDIETPQ